MLKTHLLDWRSTHPWSGSASTRCGLDASRALGVRFGVATVADPNAATCKRCQALRAARKAVPA